MCVCVFTCAALINNFNNAPKRYTWTPKRPTACQKRTTLRTWCRITSSAISYESFGFKFLFGCFEASLLPGSLAHLGAYVPFRSCSSFYVRIQQQQHGKKFLVRTCEIERERKKDREKKGDDEFTHKIRFPHSIRICPLSKCHYWGAAKTATAQRSAVVISCPTALGVSLVVPMLDSPHLEDTRRPCSKSPARELSSFSSSAKQTSKAYKWPILTTGTPWNLLNTKQWNSSSSSFFSFSSAICTRETKQRHQNTHTRGVSVHSQLWISSPSCTVHSKRGIYSVRHIWLAQP